jgi:two-component system, chemotaxis family, sensor histidine kinase and response regulator PixL
MMHDSEQQVRLQFLDEAQDYLTEIESGVLDMSTHGIERSVMDGMLRAAHSIKGGSAMMGFSTLSQLAHQMEDFFKVLKLRPAEVKEEDTERLMLTGIDHLRQVTRYCRQGTALSAAWLTETVQITFDALHDRLGDPQDEDAAALLSEEVGTDMVVLLFETEVDSILNRLDEVLESPDLPCLQEEFAIAAQELSGLGEMLDLPAFRDLCQDVSIHIKAAAANHLISTATLAQSFWRQSQSLVIVGQRALIPSTLGLEPAIPPVTAAPPTQESTPDFSLVEDDAMDWDALDLETLGDMAFETEASEAASEAVLETITTNASVPDAFNEIQDAVSEFLDIHSEPELEMVLAPEERLEPDVKLEPDLKPELKPETQLKLKPQVSQQSVKTKVVTNAASTLPSSEETTEAETVLRIPAQQINQIGELFGELIIERNGLSLQLKRLRELTGLLTQRVQTLEASNASLRSTYDAVATQNNGGRHQGPSTSVGLAAGRTNAPHTNQDWLYDQTQDFDLLEMDRYSELHTLSQALMESAVQIEEVTTDINLNLEEAEQTARAFTRTTKQLQVSMTQMRMRPVSDTFNRFSRMMRDLSLEHGKSVDLKIAGGSTLIDRVILEALTDPLVHLLRNAFDHGLEDTQTRIATGKPAKGLIEISAAYRGNQTLITIRDDGAGISLDKVKARATRIGIDSTLLDTARPSELLDLIFEPGFSTASQVTELSGRGVGMDIVRTALQKIKGSITVDTELGLGTTFTLAVPFSLSVIRVLLIESGNLLMAVPIDEVEEMLLLDPQKVSQENGQQVLQLDDISVPLVQLKDWLNFPRTVIQSDLDATPKINQPMVLLIEQEGLVVGLQVDRYWGEQEVTIRQVEGTIALPRAFVGCTILGDGRIAPLLDPLSLLQQIESQTIGMGTYFGASLGEIAPDLESLEVSASVKPLVMVVDDSVNVRRFLALTLEKAGFRVEQAKDGQHALEIVQTGLPIKAVVCDIEMPRLDGYGFLANVKSIPSAQDLPVIMLTSRSGDKHRKLAFSLGAKAYFSKPFREYDLLQTLDHLTDQSSSISVPTLPTLPALSPR